MSKKYLTNKQLRLFLKECNDKERMTDEFGRACVQLVDRMAGRSNFVHYTYIDDMKGDAILALVKAWDKIEYGSDSNPFSYMTTVANNAFLQYISKEQRQHMSRDEMLISMAHDPSDNYERNKAAIERKNEKNNKSKGAPTAPRPSRPRKLNSEQVDDIKRKVLVEKNTQKYVAAQYNVTPATISAIIRGTLYKEDD